jgi:hypothetical protein
MLGPQAHFFFEFAVHRLLGRFTELDAALWKLPRMLAHPLAPPNLILRIQQDDADVRAKAFTVKHVVPQNFLRQSTQNRCASPGSVAPSEPGNRAPAVM